MRKFYLAILLLLLLLGAGFAGAQSSAASCEKFSSGSAIPSGWGLPWIPDFLSNVLSLRATCDGTNVNIEAGNGSAISSITTQYSYLEGYHWKNEQWNKINFQCDGQALGAWCKGKVHATIQNTQDSYYVAYLCTWISSGNSSQNTGTWHCGCQNNSCTTPAWQLQGWHQVTPTPTPATNADITREDAAKVLPLSPSEVESESITGRIVLRWQGTGEMINHYNVYRKTPTEDWHLLGNVQVIGDNTSWYEFTDSTTRLGTTYIYGVTAAGNYGNESLISESSSIAQQ
jgi:hypothetical protein